MFFKSFSAFLTSVSLFKLKTFGNFLVEFQNFLPLIFPPHFIHQQAGSSGTHLYFRRATHLTSDKRFQLLPSQIPNLVTSSCQTHEPEYSTPGFYIPLIINGPFYVKQLLIPLTHVGLLHVLEILCHYDWKSRFKQFKCFRLFWT